MNSRVAKRYARALLELAAEQNQLGQWGEQLAALVRIASSREVAGHLQSPELSEEQRLQAVNIIAERLNLSFPVRSFAVVLARHGRLVELPAVLDWYNTLLDERLGRVQATITFSVQPSDGEIARVVSGLEAMSGKKVVPTIKVDPALLGGLTAQLEGRIYDASLATRLAIAEQQLSQQ